MGKGKKRVKNELNLDEINQDTVAHYLKIEHWITVNPTKIHQVSALDAPKYYKPHHFKCKSCGNLETWTAKQQQWWYEEAGGNINSIAIHCSLCRKQSCEANSV